FSHWYNEAMAKNRSASCSPRPAVPPPVAGRPALGDPPLCPPGRRALPAGEDHPVRLLRLRHTPRRERRRSARSHADLQRNRLGDPDQARVPPTLRPRPGGEDPEAAGAGVEGRELVLAGSGVQGPGAL